MNNTNKKNYMSVIGNQLIALHAHSNMGASQNLNAIIEAI